jgi:hypothetical protein
VHVSELDTNAPSLCPIDRGTTTTKLVIYHHCTTLHCLSLCVRSPLAKLIAMTMGATIVVSCISFVIGTMPRFECVQRVGGRGGTHAGSESSTHTYRWFHTHPHTHTPTPTHPHTRRYEPATCLHPACTPGPDSNCTRVICHPIPKPALHRVEEATIGVFTVEYLMRMLTVHAVPQRLIYPSAFIAGDLGMEEPGGLVKTLTYGYQGPCVSV